MIDEAEMVVRLGGRFVVQPGKEDWLATNLEWLLDERCGLLGYRPEMNSKSGASVDFHQWASWEAGSDWPTSPTMGECGNIWHRVGVQRRLLEVRAAPIASVLDVLDHVLQRLCTPDPKEESSSQPGGTETVRIDSVEVQLPPTPRLELARLVQGAELGASWLEMSLGRSEIPVEISAAGDAMFAKSPHELTAVLASRWSSIRDVLHPQFIEPLVGAESEDPGGQVTPAHVSWRITMPEWSTASITWLLVNVNAVLRSAGAGAESPGMTLSVRRLDRTGAWFHQ